MVDHVKAVIKSGKKNPAECKLRSLKLLNKTVVKAETNPEFLRYVQRKVMDRLTIFAQYCPKGMSVRDFSNLRSRGEHIFVSDEKDTRSASSFLIVLLDSIERWAHRYQTDPRTGEVSVFWRSY